ncbi:hypothetical protein COBT_001690 [Conglomerata obtusa]
MQEYKKKTKIICTLGPKSSDKATITAMIEEGMNVARLNFSHGTNNDRGKLLKELHDLRKKNNLHFGIAIDTKGPEIRLRLNNSLNIKTNDMLVFCNDRECDDDNCIHMNFNNIASLASGYCFSADDGKLSLRIEKIEKHKIFAVANNDHILHINKSANFPGISLGLPFLSSKDMDDIFFGIEHNIDFIFLSFVSSKSDIIDVRKLLIRKNVIPLIIAKIESVSAINNLDEIIEEADGIMIARGDLYAETSYMNLFSAQKIISRKVKKANKILIVATQMIESMVTENYPTRPEITDIGNAVLDGADCVMTSAETAMGDHPVQVVTAIRNICSDAENYHYQTFYDHSNCKYLLEPFEKNRYNVILKGFERDEYLVYIVNEHTNFSYDIDIHRYKYAFIVSNNNTVIRKSCIRSGFLPLYYQENCSHDILSNIQQTCVEIECLLIEKYKLSQNGIFTYFYKIKDSNLMIKIYKSY